MTETLITGEQLHVFRDLIHFSIQLCFQFIQISYYCILLWILAGWIIVSFTVYLQYALQTIAPIWLRIVRNCINFSWENASQHVFPPYRDQSSWSAIGPAGSVQIKDISSGRTVNTNILWWSLSPSFSQKTRITASQLYASSNQ